MEEQDIRAQLVIEAKREERSRLIEVVRREINIFLEVMPERQKKLGERGNDYKSGKFNAYADAHIDFERFAKNLLQALKSKYE